MNASLNSSDCSMEFRTMRVHLIDNRHAATARAFFSTLFALFTVLDNIAVMLSVQRSTMRITGAPNDSAPDKRSISKTLMMSSGFSGFLVGSLLMPLGIYEFVNSGRWYLGRELCSVRLAGLNIACAVYANHILCLSIDRYLAVCRSMLYRSLTSKLGYLMVGTSWALPFLCFMVFFVKGFSHADESDIERCYRLRDICIFVFNLKSLIKVNIFGVYIPFMTTIIIYVFILRETCRFNTRKSKRQQVSYSKVLQPALSNNTEASIDEAKDNAGETSSRNLSESSEIIREENSRNNTRSISTPQFYSDDLITSHSTASGNLSKRKQTKCAVIRSRLSVQLTQNKKAVRTIGSILLCYTLCWLPLWVCTVMGIFRLQVSDVWLFISVQWFAYLNATINPLIFCLNKSVRLEMKKLLCMLRKA
ncbi:5-hydroxytryptamine receptor 4 [Biomphalaria pfeifferi]|uniref:5-hydroxytryptamine receptor 4 n=1 Tax=Biomphalaria pfeifferi TaxID=112525 RepID=A0AAD8FI24_BIOPF|nr:5-hydroxytryptamine receptor 4 [Biomphalaria pfeifferi]